MRMSLISPALRSEFSNSKVLLSGNPVATIPVGCAAAIVSRDRHGYFCSSAVGKSVLVVAFLTSYAVAAETPEFQKRFYEAVVHQRAGEDREAFLQFAAIPGGLHRAVAVARSKPEVYLELLRENDTLLAFRFSKLIQGDLLFIQRDHQQALDCYRSMVKRIGASDNEGRNTGHIPIDAYFVDAPDDIIETFGTNREPYRERMLEPFAVGPGSHRDNWLIRRFIALKAWDDAAREFARVWELHRSRTEPYLLDPTPVGDGFGSLRESGLIRPAGFDTSGLEFAIHYAFFLRKTQHDEEAFRVLIEALLRIDLDQSAWRTKRLPIPPDDQQKFPVRPRSMAGGYAGTSTTEFIRLVFGIFKTSGKEAELIAVLQREIESGQLRLQRVLAQVRTHQGQPEQALELELAFIENSDFDELSQFIRRGLIYEVAGKLDEAAASFERALQIPGLPSNLGVDSLFDFRVLMPPGDVDPITQLNAQRNGFDDQLIKRLQRLYGALAKPERAFELSTRQFERNPAYFGNPDSIENHLVRARSLGRDAEAREWLLGQVSTLESPMARFNIYWALRDYPHSLIESIEAWKLPRFHSDSDFKQFCEQFRQVGRDELRSFLTSLLLVDPQYVFARLELIEIDGDLRGPDAIAVFESLLNADASPVFDSLTGASLSRLFRNKFDLAYRLMRMYERARQFDRLRALGLSIAAGEKPFGAWWTKKPEKDRLGEDLNASFALLIQHADTETLQQLSLSWKERGDFPAARQLARRIAGTFVGPADGKDPGWANLPEGVRAIVSQETVLALARDTRYLYSGHPWGVAVYQLDGTPVTRIALAEAANSIAVGEGIIWVGTKKGVFRIEADAWHVVRLRFQVDLPPENRPAPNTPGADFNWFDTNAKTLVLDGENLWIAPNRNVLRLNIRTLAVRAFSHQELKLESWDNFDHLLIDGDYVWASTRNAMRRYDRSTETWQAITFGGNEVNRLGLYDGQLFGHAHVDDKHRDWPCVIDRKTMDVTPLSIHGDLIPGRDYNCFGKHLGQIVSEFPATDRLSDDAVLGVATDPARSMLWLCTNRGLVALDENQRVTNRFTRDDGLCADRVTAGVRSGDKWYFSTGWGDNRGGLAVVDPNIGIFTTLFQSDGLASDKLATIETAAQGLRLVYDVEYNYGWSGNYRQFPPGLFDPATGEITRPGDPKSPSRAEVEQIQAPQFLDYYAQFSRVSSNSRQPARQMPCLGGIVIKSETIGDKQYLCGNYGLVILQKDAIADLSIEQRDCPTTVDPLVRFHFEAQTTHLSITTVKDFARFAEHKNPYFRESALHRAGQFVEKEPRAMVPLLVKLLSDTHTPNRIPAVRVLALTNDPSAITPLEQRLKEETDPRICEEIVLALARLGQFPDLKWVESLLADQRRSGINEDDFLTLAPHANGEIFAMFLKYPLVVADDYEPREKAFRALGDALRKRPESLPILLKVDSPDDPGPETNHGPARFAQEVFKFAGAEVLPQLHQALESQDRIVCSNAARACGAICDHSSVPPLIRALDLESGMSRASIVWALGQLGAVEALPRLTALYSEAGDDDRTAGFRGGQTQAGYQSHYHSFEQIDDEWDELTHTLRMRLIEPQRREHLLTRARILAAVRAFAPASTQAFYRQLAAASNSDARHEAAEQLAFGVDDDMSLNLVVLRSLMSDLHGRVRIAAAVSLLKSGHPDGQTLIQESLETEQGWIVDDTFKQLERIEDGRLLGFARPTLERLLKRPARQVHHDHQFRSLLDRIPSDNSLAP